LGDVEVEVATPRAAVAVDERHKSTDANFDIAIVL